MIARNVVLVLGAGASEAFDLPLGTELLSLVTNPVSSEIEDLLMDSGMRTRDLLKEFRDELRRFQPLSIDEFLADRTEFTDVGKRVVAYHVLNREDASKLEKSVDEGNWYPWLFRRMRDVGIGDSPEKGLGVITYNYDRSFEYALEEHLRARHKLSSIRDVRDRLTEVATIVHVHGKLGGLDEIAYGGGRTGVTSGRVRLAADSIRVIHESANDDEEFKKAHKLISEAKCIVFLGFSYHSGNVERLQLAKHITSNTYVTGTRFEITDSEITRLVEPRFEELRNNHINVNFSKRDDHTVYNLLRNNLHIFS